MAFVCSEKGGIVRKTALLEYFRGADAGTQDHLCHCQTLGHDVFFGADTQMLLEQVQQVALGDM